MIFADAGEREGPNPSARSLQPVLLSEEVVVTGIETWEKVCTDRIQGEEVKRVDLSCFHLAFYHA